MAGSHVTPHGLGLGIKTLETLVGGVGALVLSIQALCLGHHCTLALLMSMLGRAWPAELSTHRYRADVPLSSRDSDTRSLETNQGMWLTVGNAA